VDCNVIIGIVLLQKAGITFQNGLYNLRLKRLDFLLDSPAAALEGVFNCRHAAT